MGGNQTKENDSVQKGSEPVDDLLCDICNEEGKVVEPEGFCVDCSDFLCKECFKAHTKTRASRYHVLQDKTHMPQQRANANKDTSIDTCEAHSNETIKYYCRSHKTLGCGSCMIMNHRQCDGVENIADFSCVLVESQTFQQFNKKLHFLKERSQNLMTSSSGKVSAAEACCSEAVKSVKQLQADLNTILGKLATDICTEAETMKSEDMAKLTTIYDKALQVVQEVEKTKSTVTSLQHANQLSQIFIKMIKTKSKLDGWKETLDEGEKYNTSRSYKFETTAEIMQILEQGIFPGKISINS